MSDSSDKQEFEQMSNGRKSRNRLLNLTSFSSLISGKAKSVGEVEGSTLPTPVKKAKAKKHLTDVYPKAGGVEIEEMQQKLGRTKKRITKSRIKRVTNPVRQLDVFDEAEVVPISDEPTSYGNGKLSPRASPNRRGRKLKNSIYSNQSFSNRSRTFSEVIHQSLAEISQSAVNRSDSHILVCESKANEAIPPNRIAALSSAWKDSVNFLEFGSFRYDEFNFFGKEPHEMIPYLVEGIKELDLHHVFDNQEDLLVSYLLAVSEKYKSHEEVPFHSFYHGFSVAQMTLIFILRSVKLKQMFDRKNLFTLIIAAVAHDVAHPGNDNHYEIITGSDKAKTYNNDSVLENYHTRTTLEILKGTPGNKEMALNVFKYLKPETQEEAFKEIVCLILATDMSKHKEHLEFLKGVKDVSLLVESEEREKLLEAVIHAADLSGQCFSTFLAKEWEERIHNEMFAQCEKLTEKRLAVPKHLEYLRTTSGRAQLKARYESQTKFIEFALVPYWSEITRLFPEMSDFLENLERNKEFFKSEAQKL